MDPHDLETLAAELYRELGIDPERPPGTIALARRWFDHRDAVLRVSLAGPSPSRLTVVGRQRTIVVRPSVPADYLAFFVGHELGHALIQRAGLVLDDEEPAADYLGASLMLPREYIRAVVRAEGGDEAPRVAAARARCTEIAVWLRRGEVEQLPLVAVSPGALRRRGPPEWVWPEDATIRRWASGKPRPGVAKVRVSDQAKRVVLVADPDEGDAGPSSARDVG